MPCSTNRLVVSVLATDDGPQKSHIEADPLGCGSLNQLLNADKCKFSGESVSWLEITGNIGD